MQTDRRPLPDSLTRLLAMPQRRPAQVRPQPYRVDGAMPEPDRRHAHTALETAILRGFVAGLSGFVWLLILVLTVRHFVR